MPLTGFALEVHDKADIVKVTSAFLKVIPKGNRFTAICPFHADTNPSLSINPEKNIFKCFVCGAGGDSINFVRRYTGVSFREAVERVAQIMGIPIPTSFGKQTAAAPKVTGAQMALDDLQKFYRMMLVSPQGQRALDYLHNRGMDDATIEKFGIGYAPADGTMAIRSLRDKMGRSVEDLEEAGILSKGSAQLRDRYTERIMFPIRDAFGHTVGFSGRKYLPDDPSDSKYINSPETSLFIKSKLLYNLDNAWEPARKAGYIYVLEGFMDAIAVTRAGIPAAVALMGTALTKEHIGLLQRLHVQVRLCLDSDAAGQLAERNNAPLLSQAGVPYRVVKPFTQGKDADEVLHNAGPEALVAALNNLLDALTFRLQTLEPTSPDYLRSVDRIIAESGAEISVLSPSEKELLIQNLVSSTNLNEDYWRSVLTRSPAPAPQLATPSVPQQEGPTIGEATNLVGTDRKVAKLMAVDSLRAVSHLPNRPDVNAILTSETTILSYLIHSPAACDIAQSFFSDPTHSEFLIPLVKACSLEVMEIFEEEQMPQDGLSPAQVAEVGDRLAQQVEEDPQTFDGIAPVEAKTFWELVCQQPIYHLDNIVTNMKNLLEQHEVKLGQYRIFNAAQTKSTDMEDIRALTEEKRRLIRNGKKKKR